MPEIGLPGGTAGREEEAPWPELPHRPRRMHPQDACTFKMDAPSRWICRGRKAWTHDRPVCETLIYSAITATEDLFRRPRKDSSAMPGPYEIPAGLDVTLVDHPLVNSRLSIMRDIRTDNATFRVALRELTTMLVYEASRNLATERVLIDTPVAQTHAVRLADPPLLVPVLRAGLGMADQAQVLIPDAQMGFVGLARDEVTLLPTSYMESLPKSLSGRKIYALDPMLATGGSMVYAIERRSVRSPPRRDWPGWRSPACRCGL
jgi:uracil phosphoribosyltransferase